MHCFILFFPHIWQDLIEIFLKELIRIIENVKYKEVVSSSLEVLH